MKGALREILRFPSAIAGLSIIAILLALSAYAVIAIPYREAIRLWQGGEGLWMENPRNAWPVWVAVRTRTMLEVPAQQRPETPPRPVCVRFCPFCHSTS